MFVTSSSSFNSYAGTTEKSAKRGTELFFLDENRQQERGNDNQGNAQASGDTSFSAKLASMFLVPERPDVETDKASLEDDTLSIYERQFMELADKTFAERIRDQYLEDHDLTEDDLDAMSPEDREAVETEIANAILEAMGVNEEMQTMAITLDVPTAVDFVPNSAKDETNEL